MNKGRKSFSRNRSKASGTFTFVRGKQQFVRDSESQMVRFCWRLCISLGKWLWRIYRFNQTLIPARIIIFIYRKQFLCAYCAWKQWIHLQMLKRLWDYLNCNWDSISIKWKKVLIHDRRLFFKWIKKQFFHLPSFAWYTQVITSVSDVFKLST